MVIQSCKMRDQAKACSDIWIFCVWYCTKTEKLVVSEALEHPSMSWDSFSPWQTLISPVHPLNPWPTHKKCAYINHIHNHPQNMESLRYTVVPKARRGRTRTDRHQLFICIFKCHLVSQESCHAHHQVPSASTWSPLPVPFRNSRTIRMSFVCIPMALAIPLASMTNVCHTEKKMNIKPLLVF